MSECRDEMDPTNDSSRINETKCIGLFSTDKTDAMVPAGFKAALELFINLKKPDMKKFDALGIRGSFGVNYVNVIDTDNSGVKVGMRLLV